MMEDFLAEITKDKQGLYEKPKRQTPDIKAQIKRNRSDFEEHFNYADSGDTYDKKGNYSCGTCAYVRGTDCLLLDIKKIDPKAGSCEDWEGGKKEGGLKRKKPEVASYGVAKNGEGFGCKRCPYAKDNFTWCGLGAFYIIPSGCCTANGAEVVG